MNSPSPPSQLLILKQYLNFPYTCVFTFLHNIFSAVQDKEYFKCEENHGIFVRQSQITLLAAEPEVTTKQPSPPVSRIQKPGFGASGIPSKLSAMRKERVGGKNQFPPTVLLYQPCQNLPVMGSLSRLLEMFDRHSAYSTQQITYSTKSLWEGCYINAWQPSTNASKWAPNFFYNIVVHCYYKRSNTVTLVCVKWCYKYCMHAAVCSYMYMSLPTTSHVEWSFLWACVESNSNFTFPLSLDQGDLWKILLGQTRVHHLLRVPNRALSRARGLLPHPKQSHRRFHQLLVSLGGKAQVAPQFRLMNLLNSRRGFLTRTGLSLTWRKSWKRWRPNG